MHSGQSPLCIEPMVLFKERRLREVKLMPKVTQHRITTSTSLPPGGLSSQSLGHKHEQGSDQMRPFNPPGLGSQREPPGGGGVQPKPRKMNLDHPGKHASLGDEGSQEGVHGGGGSSGKGKRVGNFLVRGSRKLGWGAPSSFFRAWSSRSPSHPLGASYVPPSMSAMFLPSSTWLCKSSLPSPS